MQYYTLPFAFAAALLVSGCARPSPEEKAAQDARDVAQVEAVQKVHPPVRPIVPEPITPADFAKAAEILSPTDAVSKLPDDPEGAPAVRGCAFVPATGGAPTFAVDAKRALLKVAGELVVLAVDSGSGEVVPGLHVKYIGREYWAALTSPSSGKAELTLRDRYDRVVHTAPGKLACAAAR